MSQRGIIKAIVIIIAVIGVFVGGYNYYMDSPAHVLNMVRGSVTSHNRNLFEEYVDLDAIIGDNTQMLAELLMEDDERFRNYGHAYLLKLAEKHDAKIKEILTGHVQALLDGPKKSADGTVDTDNEAYNKAYTIIMKRLNTEHLDYMGIDTSVIHGDSAVVDVLFYDNRLKQNFTLKVNMSRDADGKWKIHELVNLREFLYNIGKSAKEAAREKNKPLKEEINKYANVHDVSANIPDKHNLSPDTWMKIYIPIKFGGNKQIRCITGWVYMKDQSNYQYRIPFDIRPEASAGDMVYTIEKQLDGFVKDADTISKLNPEKLRFGAVIRCMDFSDGTSIKLFDATDFDESKG